MARPASPALWMQAASVALLVAGLWRRDCVLLASAPLVAQRSFLLHMDRGRPWCPLRAATRALTAGVLSALAALALGLHVLGVQFGWWWTTGSPDPADFSAFAWLLGPAALLVALQSSRALMARETSFWLAMLAAAWLATWPSLLALIALSCAFALLVAALMAWSAWALAHRLGSELLRQAK
jgi:hypothetical protein